MNMQNLYDDIYNYSPVNEQEEKDKEVILDFIKNGKDILLRENKIAHMTASSWIVNKQRNKVLMIYHNIYKSWSWTGGHADGDSYLLNVAIKEAKEETGLTNITPIINHPYSIEIVTVDGHIKRKEYVSSHLHINVTYLLEADENDEIRIKEDENSNIAWFSLDDAIDASSEPWMKGIYKKLNNKLEAFDN